ncbi:hypothetical protein [Bacillus gaemokensis]|uniref:Uncharacterized protein n=1 Tax=Bacillus gaemokensis TaxID=574375 RepID=A0A073K986_9BACI|nr:hypothetical protein [Bacillus gaemokensis]KEK23854.1 hypothetical protein BAGA_05255 [Bacillus gaemokensis]KYG38095.1 hypothetical protein AZF08_20300 [Bacillus gaemokensis]
MKKLLKVLVAIMVMATSVGMFASPTKEVQAENNYKEQAQKNITVVHTIVDYTEKGLAYTLPIDDNDAIDGYILVEAKNYEQGAIVTVTMDGLGEIVNDEYTLNEELSTLYDRFRDVIDSYEESFEYEAFKSNDLEDENRNKEGYVQAEDGSWVKESFYDEGAGVETKTLNIELNDGEWAYGQDSEGYEYAIASDRVKEGQVVEVTVNEFGEVFTVDVVQSI